MYELQVGIMAVSYFAFVLFLINSPLFKEPNKRKSRFLKQILKSQQMKGNVSTK